MAQPKFITKPSYDHLHHAAIAMIREARTHGWIDAIVAPARGGLLFGMIASHKLNVPMHAVAYSSKNGAGDDKNHTNTLPDLPGVNRILLVDEICDSGHTLKEIVDHYMSKGIDVITAVFHQKDGAAYDPTIYYWRIPKDSEFIDYPWEGS